MVDMNSHPSHNLESSTLNRGSSEDELILNSADIAHAINFELNPEDSDRSSISTSCDLQLDQADLLNANDIDLSDDEYTSEADFRDNDWLAGGVDVIPPGRKLLYL